MPPSEIHFVSVGNGKLALYHRPRGVDFRTLRELGCTHVVTLMKESEGARSIGKMTENAGLTWVWIPVPNGDYPQGEVHQRLIVAIPTLSQLLDENAALIIHCSAGIHRTGTVAYGLLRWRGVTREKSLKLIEQMRPVTLAEMGEKRQRWGNEIARDLPQPKPTWFQSLQEFIRKYFAKR